MTGQMSSSRSSVAGARLALAAAALSVAAACGAAGPELAAGAGQRPAAGSRTAHKARCAKAGRHRPAGRASGLARRAGGRQACRRRKPGSSSVAPHPASEPIQTTSPVAPSSPPPTPIGPPPAPDGAPFRFFSPSGFWNAPLADDAPLDPDSAALTDAFAAVIARERKAGTGPWINTTDYGVPIYTVPADQPTVRVQLASSFSAPALQSAWNEVPMPPATAPSSGSDRTLVLWQPSRDRMWEFWKLTQGSGGWQASWGGAMQEVSSNQGVYGPEAWPGAKPWWGSSASSLSIAGGLITLEDLRRGQIDHALALAIPNVRASFYASPAQRTDGRSTTPLSLPEGARLRLDPSLDLSSLHLPPLTLMIAEAAQRHGILVRDRAKVTHFFAQDPGPTGTNPYAGVGGYFGERSPAQLLSRFPWDRLQLLRMELRRRG
jgi:hypothetical protein